MLWAGRWTQIKTFDQEGNPNAHEHGSHAPFITHLVQAQRLSKKEKEAIRKLLET